MEKYISNSFDFGEPGVQLVTPGILKMASSLDTFLTSLTSEPGIT